MSSAKSLAKHLPSPIRRRLGELRRRLGTRASRTEAQKKLLLTEPSLEDWERELLTQTSSRIFHNDGMYAGDGARYFKVGLSAMSCIDEAVRNARLEKIENILDLPCGGGRVLRFLPCRFPAAKVWACDLQRDMVDFCAREFSATPVYSAADFDQLSIDASFDLIWCGSLVTHLNAPGIRSLLGFFSRHLRPGGVLVLSTHGERAAELMLNQEIDYGVSGEALKQAIARFRADGFGFASYPNEDDYGVPTNEGQYGISLTARAWIAATAQTEGLEEEYFAAHGWDNHQDVFGFLKR
jgi:SAM-dependent methyltransferase